MIRSDIKLHRSAEKTLQQRVVQILSDACPLGKPFFKAHIQLSGQSVQPQAVKEQYGKPHDHHAGEAKPPGLPEYRLDFELDRRLQTIPEPITVAGNDSEAVCAWAEVGVDGFAGGDRFAPILIEAIQFVSEPDTFGNRKTQTCIAEG